MEIKYEYYIKVFYSVLSELSMAKRSSLLRSYFVNKTIDGASLSWKLGVVQIIRSIAISYSVSKGGFNGIEDLE